MAHFAHINKDGIVDAVHVTTQETLNQNGGWRVGGELKPVAEWVQTSYNTKSGKYTKGDTEQEKLLLKNAGATKDIEARNRKNYAGIGFRYDPIDDMFIPPQPFLSWGLNKETANWEAPKKYPADGKMYKWDEVLLDWVTIE